MRTPKLLIVYASKYGQTEKIARRIAQTASVESTVVPVSKAGSMPLQDFDLLIVASAVYFGRHNRKIEEFVKQNLQLITAMQAAFVSVSGSRDEALVHDFARRTGWVPEIYTLVGGAEPYTKYGFFTRMIMRSIARKHGREVDVHRDYELTDWDAVDRFARDFIGYVNSNGSRSASR